MTYTATRMEAWRPNYLLDGVNHMDDVADFLHRWQHGGSGQALALVETPFGNINQTGIPGDYRSPDLAKTEARFFDGIEPGVRELVQLLIERFDWTTYTSCQGHEYPGTNITPVERHVGILPRDAAQYGAVRHVIEQLVGAFAQVERDSPVQPHLFELTLTSNDGSYAVIDLVFRRSPNVSWPEYFVHLEPAYRTTLELLAGLEP